jgi:hypothetical protein
MAVREVGSGGKTGNENMARREAAVGVKVLSRVMCAISKVLYHGISSKESNYRSYKRWRERA